MRPTKCIAPIDFQLPPRTVHVWRIDASFCKSETASLMPLLSEEERTRAARFRFEPLRREYVIRWNAVRQILATYSGCQPQDLRFATNAWGKPSIASPADAENLQFNVSHASPLALLAVTRDHELGVDVERISDDIGIAQIVEQFCSPRERAVLQNLAEPLSRAAMFRCWVRKEALAKAVGRGLSLPLKSLDVMDAPPADEPARWTIFDLPLAPPLLAAVAVERGVDHIETFDWRHGP